MQTDLDELPRDRPTYYYTRELERALSQLNSHNLWVRYHTEKIAILKGILKERGVE